MNEFAIKIINIKKKILYKKNTTLLFILELNNIYVEYQCRSGYCGMCRIKLIKGNVLYLVNQPIAAMLTNKDIFPCCCQPNGNITIKI